jgi:hypothetical protein
MPDYTSFDTANAASVFKTHLILTKDGTHELERRTEKSIERRLTRGLLGLLGRRSPVCDLLTRYHDDNTYNLHCGSFDRTTQPKNVYSRVYELNRRKPDTSGEQANRLKGCSISIKPTALMLFPPTLRMYCGNCFRNV